MRQFNATLHVLFVQDPLLASAGNLEGTPSADLKKELAEFIAGTPELGLTTEPAVHVLTGQPAEEIVRFAEREHIDSIVIGAHGLTGIAKAFFGSTAARVLKRTTVPLLIVPASAGADKGRDLAGLGSILVLTDFGSASACAANAAASLAAMIGARLVLVHVMPTVSVPTTWASRAGAATACRDADAHQRMCRAMAPLEKYGPVESVIVGGNIGESVARLARAHHSGLIVIGLDAEAHGSRPGSTAYAVICGTPVPVLVLPAVVADVFQSPQPHPELAAEGD